MKQPFWKDNLIYNSQNSISIIDWIQRQIYPIGGPQASSPAPDKEKIISLVNGDPCAMAHPDQA